jgi:hypothetical protein
MKKIAFCLTATCLSLTFHPLQSNATATVVPSSLVDSKLIESAEAKTLLFRLNEINAIDKSSLKPSDKKSLQVEVRSIKCQLRAIGGGVYISAGAIILIVILLIILF